MTFSKTLSSILFLLSGLSGIVLLYIMFKEFRNRKSFRLYSYFMTTIPFVGGMLAFAAGFQFHLGYLVVAGFLMLAFWVLGSIWVEYSDVSVATLQDKITLYFFTAIPFAPILVFAILRTFVTPLNVNLLTQANWLNLLGTAGIFGVWLVSFLASRLRSSYMFRAVSFLFFAAAALALRANTDSIWILASSLLYFAGILSYIYTWVSYGQNS